MSNQRTEGFRDARRCLKRGVILNSKRSCQTAKAHILHSDKSFEYIDGFCEMIDIAIKNLEKHGDVLPVGDLRGE